MRKRILMMMSLSILAACGILSVLWSRLEGGRLFFLAGALILLIVAGVFWAVTQMLRPLQRITQTLSSVGSLVSMVSQDLTSKSSVLSGSVEETSALMAEMGRGLTQNAERASSLASSVTQASASIEEMGSSIQEVAKNIGHAEVLASETAILAQAGDEAVRSVVDGIQKASGMVQASAEAVSQLGQKSDEIGRIVSVIDEIADQTNLLALNAAIEAARAGEQGRGFAVVADEVRKLAEKTGQATREIGDLIRNIQKDLAEAVKGMEAGRKGVAEGVDLSEQAQQSLGDIRSAAAKLGDLMKEVAKAATEQANAAGEITRVANDMARMTEEFSSSSQAGRESGNQVIRAMDKAATITRESLEQIELLGKSAVELEDQAREIQRLM